MKRSYSIQTSSKCEICGCDFTLPLSIRVNGKVTSVGDSPPFEGYVLDVNSRNDEPETVSTMILASNRVRGKCLTCFQPLDLEVIEE